MNVHDFRSCVTAQNFNLNVTIVFYIIQFILTNKTGLKSIKMQAFILDLHFKVSIHFYAQYFYNYGDMFSI